MGRSIEYALAAGIVVGSVFGARPALASGGCRNENGVGSDACQPKLVKFVSHPHFLIAAYVDPRYPDIIDLNFESRTSRFFGWIPTNRGAEEAVDAVERYCGPTGDHTLVVFQGPQSDEIGLKRADCLNLIPNSRIETTPP
jgi:hypothetical protein